MGEERPKGGVYLWLEDRQGKSGYTFWKVFMQQIAPSVVVESKKNSSELFKAVRDLQDKDNQYIIVYDNSFDNIQVYQEQRLLKEQADKRANVKLLGLICFEYTLLEFNQLIRWIYAPDDEFLIRRSAAVKAREVLVESIRSGDVNYKTLQEILDYDEHLGEHNIEQLSAKLLFDLTRNTGFEVSKKKIGDCWIKSCCGWLGKQADDLCGLDRNPLNLTQKMQCIYQGTSLEKELSSLGLEAVL